MAAPAPALIPIPGDTEFAAAIESHGRYYRRVAETLVGPDDAQDAVQDGLLLGWKYRAGFRRDCTLAVWLGIVIRRACLDRIRRSGPTVDCLPLEDWAPFAVDERTIEKIYRAEQRRLVLRFLPRIQAAPRSFVRDLLSGRPMDLNTRANKAARHRAVRGLAAAIGRP
jgi:DNA-directed RNA polymerase specialized sigma24 family protein